MLRAARTSKRGASLFAFGAQPVTHQGYAPWPASAPSRRASACAPSLWLRRPAGACGRLRGHRPAASDADRALIGSFGVAAVGGRGLGGCWLPAGLDSCRHTRRKTGLDSSINSIRLIHIGKHARFHLSVSACVIIVIGDNLGKRLGYGLRDISGD